MLGETIAGAGLVALLSGAAPPPADRAALPIGDVRDFDFLVGKWALTNRRLKKRWAGSDDWDVFPGTLRCESLLDGVVNWDEGYFPTKGMTGVTLRLFDRARRQWLLYWVNGASGTLFPPVAGGFTGNRGTFFGDDTDEGHPIKVVFRWRHEGRDSAVWEQAFSRDGTIWETNWIIEHRRMKD